MNLANKEHQQRIAAEVFELGESLFETALEMSTQQPPVDQAGESSPIEELRAATQEFFTAVRLLVGLEGPSVRF